MKERRQARELALQALYACDVCGESDPHPTLAYLAQEDSPGEEALRYGTELALAVLANRPAIDAQLAEAAANWDLRRMAAVDRNILRVAAAELLYHRDVPYRVVIDEAVEIAKRFGSDDSAKFVNGVIDAIYRKQQAAQGD